MSTAPERGTEPLAELSIPTAQKVIGIGLGLSPAGLALFALAGWAAYLWSLGAETVRTNPMLWVGSGALALGALAAIRWTIQGWDLRLRVYPDGYERRHRGQLRYVPFAEVVALWDRSSELESGLGIELRYELELAGGERIGVHRSDRQAMARFGPALVGAYSAFRLPEAQAALDAGQALSCGPLQLSRDALIHGTRHVAWSAVRDVGQRVPPGEWCPYLAVELRDGSELVRIRLAEIPDALVVLQLARWLAGLKD